MATRIVLFGATGYTGKLVAAALVDAGVRPVLAGRNPGNLAALGVELGKGLDTAVVDVTRPESLFEALRPGDVLVSTVGPFTRLGGPIIDAAIDRQVTYIDSAGEPAWLRTVFETFGPIADEAGVALLPSFAFEFVAGNLAAWLAAEPHGDEVTKVEVGYFVGGKLRKAISAGTMASVGGAVVEPNFAWRDGQLVTVPAADQIRSFAVDGTMRRGLAYGGSEHFTLPRLIPSLREVGVYVGGPKSERAARVVSRAAKIAPQVPGVPQTVRWATSLPHSKEGPDSDDRARSSGIVIATAYNAAGTAMRTVRLGSTNPYTFTGNFLAWAAQQVAAHGVRGQGAIGPLEAFEPDTLREGVAKAGLDVQNPAPPAVAAT